VTMTGSPVSTNNVRINNTREGGRRLSGVLCFLVFLVILIMWAEDLVELPQAGDHASYVISKSDFAWRPLHNAKEKLTSTTYLTDDGGDITITASNGVVDDDDDDLFSSLGGNVGMSSRNKKIQGRPKKKKSNANGSSKSNNNSNNYMFTSNQSHPRNQDHKHRKVFIRKKNGTDKLKPFPVVQKDDDAVPLAKLSVGTFLHAADALLCRESVIDYVINATDLKDECDGLKKAYTTNCGADEQNNEPEESSYSSSSTSRERQRRRLLPSKQNPVMYWQRRLFNWSRAIRSWLMKLSTPATFEVKQMWWDLSSYYHNNIARKLRNDGRNSEFSNDAFLNWKESLLNDKFHRKTTNDAPITNPNQKENEDNPPKKEPLSTTKEHEQPLRNATKTKTISKPLANIALPITSKHVSGKILTETLMLQQDNKLMKAIQNQTNTTFTEAQTDAAISSKAVSDAADMVSNVLNDPTSVEARTCCTSILNVFHENCNVNEEEELSDRRLFVGVMVVAFCGLVKSLIRHFSIRWLPEAAGCILVGVSAGYILTFYPHHDISFDGNWFLRIMVPPIVFEAALSIDKRSFSRHIVPILFYAVIGTLIATGATAFVVHEGSKLLHGLCETIPYPEALAFGALISSIDPIAVLSVLSNMGMTDQDTIYVVIFGESLLNDGVAIVLFETLVHFMDDNMIVDGNAVTAAAIHFIVVFIGSLLIGIGYGLCCTLYYWIMIGCQTPLVEVLMFCCWALLPYYVCDGIEWSGIVAVVAAGFLMDMYVVGTENSVDVTNDDSDLDHNSTKNSNNNGMIHESSSFSDCDTDNINNPRERRRRSRVRRPIFSKEGLLSRKAKTHIVFVTEIIATMMETAIFAYLGLFLFSSRYHWNFYHVIIAIAGCCLSRAVMIPSLSFIANWITKMQQSGTICRLQDHPHQSQYPDTPTNRPNLAAGVIIDSKMQLVLWFAGLRGAMSFALVEHIPLYDAVSGEGTRLKSELKAMTSACIIFTVFILGGSTFYIMEALGLSPQSRSEGKLEHEMEMIRLIGSVAETSTDAEDGLEEIEGNECIPEFDKNGTEIYKRTPSNILQSGRPVRRQRNTTIK